MKTNPGGRFEVKIFGLFSVDGGVIVGVDHVVLDPNADDAVLEVVVDIFGIDAIDVDDEAAEIDAEAEVEVDDEAEVEVDFEALDVDLEDEDSDAVVVVVVDAKFGMLLDEVVISSEV